MKEHLSWLRIAEEVLQDSDTPLHSKEIVQRAIRRRLVSSTAENPDHSLQAAIWRNIRRKGDQSVFRMLGTGRRHRKYWLKTKLSAMEQGIEKTQTHRRRERRAQSTDRQA